MSGNPQYFLWPSRTWPVVQFAGQFNNTERGFRTTWFAPTHAINLHSYTGVMRIDREEFELQPGDLTLTPRGAVASYDLPKGGQTLCVHFDSPSSSHGDIFLLPLRMPLGPAWQLAESRLLAIAELLSGREAFGLGVAAASAAVQELLLWLAIRYASQISERHLTRTEQAVEEAAAWLGRNFERPVSMADVSHAVGLSQNYLARHFRVRYGMTMPHYLLTRRMEHAQYLLTHTDLPIKTVAARSGMPDLQHFNKLFRATNQQSPSALRAASRK
jgi:AraC-like DNA-binding protein